MAFAAASPGAAAPAAAAASAPSGEPAAASAGAAAGRGERRAEAGAQVGDAERRRAAAEVAGRADPEDRARLVELLGHVQLRVLQHALGDPEGDPVDEVALPELERCRRRVLEAREVLEVVPERRPALRLELRVLRAAPPQP